MKITLLAETLQKKLSLVTHAISTKSQLPILLNILLKVKDGTLCISSTDLEIGVQIQIPVDVNEEGATTVPAKTFTELIGSLVSEKITIETKDQILEVHSKKSKSIFQTIPAEDFPKLYENRGNLVATIQTADLKGDFASVIFASSNDTARPALSGVLIRREKEGFLLVATDGYRLSLKHYALSLPPQDASEEDGSMIVPSRVFRELIALKNGEKVSMYVGEQSNQILFEQEDTILIGRLIEAEFPPFAKIIPTEFSVKAEFDREEMLKAVKICSIFARDSANIIRFSLSNGKIIVSSQAASVGENMVEVEAQIKGEENEIAFNAHYLLDCFSNIEADNLVFEMTGPLNPGVFKIKDDPSFLHLVMPVRIQQ